ncbi:MAG TPA: ATP-binding cassette domain-containing protein [Gemmatimonadaceae bacterium]|nr:ATP-binding cassette domain-containing protein [Gemmatimonadaceae bacterium]
MTALGAALAAHAVVKRFGAVTALDGVSMRAASGETVALVGESGSGKTTLLRCFNALTVPDAGRVTVDDTDVAGAGADPVALRRRIGYVQQDGGLLPHWTVQRNVELVPRLRAMPDAAARAAEALDLVGLDAARFGARWPRDLSGGQRQRVAIARALAAHPDAVLLDEPFGALDAITRGELREAFTALRARLRLTTVIVTHDLSEAVALADRVVVLRGGRVEQDAAPRDLLAAPASDYVRTLLARAGVRP